MGDDALESQDLLAKLLDAKHITDTNRGHNIEVYQPQLVTDATREVVDEVRGSSTATASPTPTSSPSATASPTATALAATGGPTLVAPLALAAPRGRKRAYGKNPKTRVLRTLR